jgi:death on curing protein
VTVDYLDLIDYLAIAAEVTGLDEQTVVRIVDIGLADSALHAPAAGSGDTDFYPAFVDKAAVLAVRLAKNHPLPDGNKRAAWVALRIFHRNQRLVLELVPDGGRGGAGGACDRIR